MERAVSSSENQVALSPQQQRLRAGSGARAYRSALVGESSLPFFLGFEFYNLALQNLGGALGLLFRQKTLPVFLAACGRKVLCARGVTIRHPERTTLGDFVFLDEGALLDQRGERQNSSQIVLGESVVIGRGTILVAKEGEILLARGVNVSSQCRIATQSRIEIGESTLIAAYVYIGPGNHLLHTDDSTPLIERGMEIKGGVKIGKNVWIGAHSTVLDGVSIGDNAVVGAHSLVKDDVPPRTVVAGVPARVIREL